jgi:hypothetical protein
MIQPQAGDSTEQRNAEAFLLNGLAAYLSLPEGTFCKKEFHLPNGGSLEVDGFCSTPHILCEAWAHIGPPKSAQKHKVMTDALKLIYASQHDPKPDRLILVFADERAAAFFTGESWMAGVLKSYNIEVIVIPLANDIKQAVLLAQQRQYR